MRTRLSRAGFVLAWVLVFGGPIIGNVRTAFDPSYFNDDVRQQIWPFLRWEDPRLFVGDYIADYYLACLPTGFKALYSGAALLGQTIPLSRGLPYILLISTLGAIGLATRRLSGGVAAWFALAFALASDLLLAREIGGLPRSFAFPVLAGAIAALVAGRPWALVAVTCLGSAFYPMTGAVSGISLAVYLLCLPAADRGEARDWSARKRWLVVVGTALACALIVLPNAVATRAYAPMISSYDVETYPELGPEGRYGPDDRAPFPNLLEGVLGIRQQLFKGQGEPFIPGAERWLDAHPGIRAGGEWLVLLAILAGGGLLLRERRAARRLPALLVAVASGYLAAVAVAPHMWLPQRYLIYTVPILIWILFPASLSALFARMPERWISRSARPVWLAGCCALVLVTLGKRGPGPTTGYTGRVDPGAPIFRALRELPPDALVAGWPAGTMEYVPYICRRSVLVSRELHQVFYVQFADEMRRRMDDLLDAYFARDVAALIRLRDEHGVSHLVLDLRYYAGPLSYFEPFGSDASRRYVGDPSTLATVRLIPDILVYDGSPTFVLDLARIEEAAPPRPATAGP